MHVRVCRFFTAGKEFRGMTMKTGLTGRLSIAIASMFMTGTATMAADISTARPVKAQVSASTARLSEPSP